MVRERLFGTQQIDGKEINSLWHYRDVEDVRTIFMGLIPVYHYERQDRLTEKYALVSPANDGHARQADLARAFGYGIASVRRWQRGYTRHGISGLGRKPRRSPRLKVEGAMDRAIRALVRRGQNNLQIAQALGVAESTIRRSRERLGLPRVAPASTEPLPLPGPRGADEPTCETATDQVSTPAGALGTDEITPVSAGAPAHQEATQAGALPAGIDLVADTITGTPTILGPASFTVTATSAEYGCTGSQAYTIGILDTTAPTVTATTPPGSHHERPHHCHRHHGLQRGDGPGDARGSCGDIHARGPGAGPGGRDGDVRRSEPYRLNKEQSVGIYEFAVGAQGTGTTVDERLAEGVVMMQEK